jgi:hypothetical protein
VRRKRSFAVAALALALAALPAAAAAASLPRAGVFVPGSSLGGVGLGMTKAEVKATWGTRFGRCRDCARVTWYYNYRPFEPQGAAVTFQRGRVVRVFTVWQPEGWRTSRGLTLGAPEAEIDRVHGTLVRRSCVRYTALVAANRPGSAFYVYDGELWGFGLSRPDSAPCP